MAPVPPPGYATVIRGGREEEMGNLGRDGREGRTDGREGCEVTYEKWVHMAWKGCIIRNPSEARYNQLVNQYFISTRFFFRLVKAMVADDQIN